MNCCNEKKYIVVVYDLILKREQTMHKKASFRSSDILATNLKWNIISYINILLIFALWIFFTIKILFK